MKTTTENPKNINSTFDGRTAKYVAGIASPAVFYWSSKRGDKTRLRLSRKNSRNFSGIIFKNGSERAVMVTAQGYWWIG